MSGEAANDTARFAGITLWTIGHSVRPIEELVAALAAHGITALADVRRHAGSRRYPQFNPENLAQSLPAAGIVYLPYPELGGRRRPRPDSVNTAWRSSAFQGYADFMESEEFEEAVARLMEQAKRQPTAVMCAEILWWRCHRALIADYVQARGAVVLHIADERAAAKHPYTSAARIVDGELSYRAEDHSENRQQSSSRNQETAMTEREFDTVVEGGERGRVFITIPFDPAEAWGKKARHYVAGTINGVPFEGSLGSRNGSYFMPVNKDLQKATGLAPGGAASVVIDQGGAVESGIPEDLERALAGEQEARRFFDELSAFYRNQYTEWIAGAKKAETRASRVATTVELLKERRKQR